MTEKSNKKDASKPQKVQPSPSKPSKQPVTPNPKNKLPTKPVFPKGKIIKEADGGKKRAGQGRGGGAKRGADSGKKDK